MTQEESFHLDLKPVFEALERPLAIIDNPERRREIETYLGAAEVHLERAIFDLLAGAVQAVNKADAGVHASLQYEDGGLRLTVREAAAQSSSSGPRAEAEEDRFFAFDGDMEKVTIRLPKELKELIDQAASLRGLSANSWYLRELARTVARDRRRGVPREPRPPWRENRPRRGSSLRGVVGD